MRLHALVAVLLVLAGCAGGAVPTDSAPTTAPMSADDLGSSAPDTGPVERATVRRVIDGDTVEVRLADGTEETIRLLGVDTPEVHAENTPDEFEGVPETEAGRQCLRTYGERASDFAERELAGREVGIGYDPTEERRGYYRRLLAYVYVDGEQFNARLVAGGWGRVFDSKIVERDRYLGLERRAQRARRGLWTCADGTPVPATAETPAPTEPGTANVGGVGVQVQADAPGDDRENLNAETVTVVNEGRERYDLTGWTVRDEAGHVYRFPDGTVLGPGTSITLHTGSGRDGDGHYYWNRSSPVWNNDGDTATLRDESGQTVARREY